MKGSLIAGAVVAALGLVSMGFLGIGLYYLTYPLHYPLFGDINDWQGTDLFWPAIILAGMSWAVCFPVAGYVDGRLKRAGKGPARRRMSYLVVLWLGAALVWILVATTAGFRFPAGFLLSSRGAL